MPENVIDNEILINDVRTCILIKIYKNINVVTQISTICTVIKHLYTKQYFRLGLYF